MTDLQASASTLPAPTGYWMRHVPVFHTWPTKARRRWQPRCRGFATRRHADEGTNVFKRQGRNRSRKRDPKVSVRVRERPGGAPCASASELPAKVCSLPRKPLSQKPAQIGLFSPGARHIRPHHCSSNLEPKNQIHGGFLFPSSAGILSGSLVSHRDNTIRSSTEPCVLVRACHGRPSGLQHWATLRTSDNWS